ncbi:MAG: hypothetical protein OXG11_04705 [Chloroflexi bacterium]|nr:hypothetical protein [Chloroflexota bacterium]
MDSSDFIPLLLTAVAGFFIAMMFSKIWVPFAKPPPGVEVHSTKLGFLQKVMVHRWHLLIVLGLANLGSIPGIEVPGIPANALVLIILFVILIVVLPTRYRFTAEGFALGRGRIMPWKDFKRYRLGPGRIQFETKGENSKRVDIFVTNVQQQALRPVIKRYFRAGP